MSLTKLQYTIKILKTLFYVAFLWTVALQGYRFLQFFFFDDDEDASLTLWKFLLKTLRKLVGIFLYLSFLLLAVALLVSDLSAESDETLENRGPTAIHRRKLLTGFLKETGTQTYSVIDTYTRATVTVDESVYTSNHSSSIRNHVGVNTGAIEIINLGTTRTWHDFINQTFSMQDFGLSGGVSSLELPFGCDKFVVESDSTLVTFEDLEGIEKLKNILNECVIKPFISHPNTSVEAPRGIMLIGGRGSGKTCISKGIVRELREKTKGDVKFYKVDVSKCFGYFVSAGITIRDVFQDALEHSSLSVILFENIDKMYAKSVPIFLSDMSAIPPGKMLVIATARKREELDERLVQIHELGQFDYAFEIELPSFQERVEILRSHFSKKFCPVLPQHILDLAKTTVSFNAGELERLASLINMKAIKSYTRPVVATNTITNTYCVFNHRRSTKKFQTSETSQKRKILPRGHLRRKKKIKQSSSKVSGSTSSVNDNFNYDSDSEDLISQVLHWAFESKY